MSDYTSSDPGILLQCGEVAPFEHRLQRAVDRVRVVLDATKHPCFAGEVHHEYEDKYLLAEFLTNAAAASQLNCLALLGLTPERLETLRGWAEVSEVSLRLRTEERCSFLREEVRDVEAPTRRVQELSVGGAVQSALTSKVVTKVTEYFWSSEVSYELLAIRGAGATAEDRLQLLERTGRDEIRTSAKTAPHPEALVPAFEADVTLGWLFRQLLAGSTSPGFKVDRDCGKCRTPRRNPEVEAAEEHFSRFRRWALKTEKYLKSILYMEEEKGLVLSVIPLLCSLGSNVTEAADGAAGSPAAAAGSAATAARMLVCASGGGGALLSPGDTNRLLEEELRALEERCHTAFLAYPTGDEAGTAKEARLMITLKHCADVCEQWRVAVDYIEALLHEQLVKAIGKEVSPADIDEYMRFHYRKLFADEYAPKPFCYPVRRSEEHAPEGTLSIEQQEFREFDLTEPIAEPIATLAARSARPQPMQFPLGAATSVRFGGERYLHAWLSHDFTDSTPPHLHLVARARQFSSMVVLVGRIASATVFEPKYAAIVQNKDELKIPLDLSTLPTPKEFKDAVESLSPEQRAFAKAFRAMQLESTLFGVLVVQIKPQLEKVLNLAADSLTKEIKLTQDILELFIKYQIPSDLLSFDAGARAVGVETAAATPSERLDAVKGHVKAIQEMIESAKKEEIAERRMEEEYKRPQVKRMPSSSSSDSECEDGVSSEEDCEEDCEVCSNMDLGCDLGCDMLEAEAFGAGMEAELCVAEAQCFMAAAPMEMASAPMEMAAAPMEMAAAPMEMGGICARQAPVQGDVAQPTRQQQQPETPQPPRQTAGTAAPACEEAVDYTRVPKELDQRYEQLDIDGALRPTIIDVMEFWQKRAHKSLLAPPVVTMLCAEEQKQEKDAAFDLLDALTKSGALTVDHAALHVVVAATHCFDKSVLETVVQGNVNPIDKVERSSLIMASTIHRQPASALIRQSQYPRVSGTSPMLFVEDAAAGARAAAAR